jgi:hypothetical protein
MFRKVLALWLVALVVAVLVPAAAGAVTARPAWTVTSLSTPTNFAPGDGVESFDMYTIRVINSGGAPTDGTPITVSDTVPSPLTYDPEGGYGGGVEGFNNFGGSIPCSGGQTATCTFERVLQPGESLTMHIPVDTPMGAPASVVNEASVGGGGAPSASVSETTKLTAAPPAFGFQQFDGSLLGPDGQPDVQAGSHPYSLALNLDLNTLTHTEYFSPLDPAGNPKQLVANLPAGVVLNPSATLTRCTEAQLESDYGGSGCPDSSAVGTITATIGIFGVPNGTSTGLFNMVPPPGVPAELGFDADGLGLYFHLFGSVRTDGDYGLSATASDLFQYGSLDGVRVELWGDPSDPSHDPLRGRCGGHGNSCPTPLSGKPLLTLPTACSSSLVSSVSGDSWQEPGSFVSDSFAMHDSSGSRVSVTGCSGLDFSPTLSVAPDTSVAGAPSGLRVDLHVPQEESIGSLAEANLKKAAVTLPIGVAVSAAAANGVGPCSPGQIGLHDGGRPSCPDSSKVGSVEIVTPLLPNPLEGSVYVGQQGNNPFGSLLALYLVAEGEGALIKLPGEVRLDAVSGQLTATFDDAPQLPFSELKLNLYGGPRAALVTPSSCGTYMASGALTPWSSETAVVSNSAFQVSQGCHAPRFAPSFTAGTTNNQGGGFSPLSVTFWRSDQDEAFGSLRMQTPPGLLGLLKTVPLCGEAQASQGTCGAESLIGHTTILAGPGPDPVTVTGQVFLTGPCKGAPFGLSIVVPAVAVPFNLGTVVVRASIAVDPVTAALTVTSDALPSILRGIPLSIKTVNVTVDRPGFTFNPTSCQPLTVTGTLTSVAGAQAPVSSSFQAANCAALAFRPGFSASSSAKTSRAGGASVDVRVTYTSGQANIHSVAVKLPKQLPARLSTVQQACPAQVFEANPASCDAGAVVGQGTALTPILAAPLTGPAYLVSHGGAAFPDIVVVLQGQGITLDLVGNVFISKSGVTSATFANVPDAPISSFDLNLPTGSHSALTAVGSLCAQPLSMPTTINGQNGAQIKQTTKIKVTGCTGTKKKAKRHKKKHKAKRGSLRERK